MEAWLRYYNEDRPHGAIGRTPPIAVLSLKAAQPAHRSDESPKLASAVQEMASDQSRPAFRCKPKEKRVSGQRWTVSVHIWRRIRA